jgi:lysophospholipase L1-like esterase
MQKSSFTFILVFFWGIVCAQHPQKLNEIEDKYAFLKAENAKLRYYGDSTSLISFFEKFEKLNVCGDGKLNISHFGGSHVQAGTLSRTIWRNMQSLYPEAPGAPGFVFPFHLAKTNNPAHYHTESNGEWTSIRSAKPSEQARWGMSAITVHTRDTSGYIHMFNTDKDDTYWAFDRIKIYTPLGDSCFTITPDSSLGVLETRIDSIAGMIEWVLDSVYTRVHFHWNKTDSLQRVLYLDGIQLSGRRPGITYHGMGANGNSTESLVRSVALYPQLKYLESDLAVFGIGINDAHKSEREFKTYEYKNNYRKIIDTLRAYHPEMAIIFVTNNDSYYKQMPNPNARKVQRALRELAEEYGGWVFDLFDYMGGMNASQVWHRHGLGKRDKIHFTPEGYRIQADAMFQSLQREFFDYLQQKYPEPLTP